MFNEQDRRRIVRFGRGLLAISIFLGLTSACDTPKGDTTGTTGAAAATSSQASVELNQVAETISGEVIVIKDPARIEVLLTQLGNGMSAQEVAVLRRVGIRVRSINQIHLNGEVANNMFIVGGGPLNFGAGVGSRPSLVLYQNLEIGHAESQGRFFKLFTGSQADFKTQLEEALLKDTISSSRLAAEQPSVAQSFIDRIKLTQVSVAKQNFIAVEMPEFGQTLQTMFEAGKINEQQVVEVLYDVLINQIKTAAKTGVVGMDTAAKNIAVITVNGKNYGIEIDLAEDVIILKEGISKPMIRILVSQMDEIAQKIFGINIRRHAISIDFDSLINAAGINPATISTSDVALLDPLNPASVLGKVTGRAVTTEEIAAVGDSGNTAIQSIVTAEDTVTLISRVKNIARATGRVAIKIIGKIGQGLWILDIGSRLYEGFTFQGVRTIDVVDHEVDGNMLEIKPSVNLGDIWHYSAEATHVKIEELFKQGLSRDRYVAQNGLMEKAKSVSQLSGISEQDALNLLIEEEKIFLTNSTDFGALEFIVQKNLGHYSRDTRWFMKARSDAGQSVLDIFYAVHDEKGEIVSYKRAFMYSWDGAQWSMVDIEKIDMATLSYPEDNETQPRVKQPLYVFGTDGQQMLIQRNP